MKKKFFVLLAFALLLAATAPGYASPVEGQQNSKEATLAAPDDGEPGIQSQDNFHAPSDLLAFNQEGQEEGGGSTQGEPEEDLDEIVDDALDHWEDKPTGEPWPMWIGWIVAAALILQRLYAYFKQKTGEGKG